jgi:hypothetical protein
MGNRQTVHRVLTLFGSAAAAVCLSAGAAASVQDGVAPRPGVTVTVQTNVELTVTWVFRGEDLFACETVAYDLRRILGEYAGRVDVRAIGIDTDDELVASFLRKERLPIAVAPYSEVQYWQAFHTESSPAVFITRAGEPVRSVFASDGARTGQVNNFELYDLVGQLLARPAHTLARAQ